MNTYRFQLWVTEPMRDNVTIQLRRDGFSAWRDADTLHTDATRAEVLFAAGHGQTLAFTPPSHWFKAAVAGR